MHIWGLRRTALGATRLPVWQASLDQVCIWTISRLLVHMEFGEFKCPDARFVSVTQTKINPNTSALFVRTPIRDLLHSVY